MYYISPLNNKNIFSSWSWACSVAVFTRVFNAGWSSSFICNIIVFSSFIQLDFHSFLWLRNLNWLSRILKENQVFFICTFQSSIMAIFHEWIFWLLLLYSCKDTFLYMLFLLLLSTSHSIKLRSNWLQYFTIKDTSTLAVSAVSKSLAVLSIKKQAAEVSTAGRGNSSG